MDAWLATIAWPALTALMLKSSLLLLATLALLFLLRRQPPAQQHFLLAISLLSLLLLPFLQLLLPAWGLSLLPGPSPQPPAVAAGPTPLPPPPWAAAEAVVTASPPPATAPFPWGSLAAAVWLAGMALLLLGIVSGLAGARRLERSAEPLPGPSWDLIGERFRRSTGMGRQVRLVGSPHARVPITWGVLHPVVILPSASRSWPWPQRQSALFHELAHIRRRDFLLRLLARLARAVYWLQPLGWIAYRRLILLQEKACDEMVIRLGVRPSAYAGHLLEIRRGMAEADPAAMAALAMAGASHFKQRLAGILADPPSQKKETAMKTRWIVALIMFLALLFVGTADPFARDRGTDGTPTVAPASATEPATPAPATEKKKEKEKKTVRSESRRIQFVSDDGKTFTIVIDDDGKPTASKKCRPVVVKTTGDKKGKEKSVIVIAAPEGPSAEAVQPEGKEWTARVYRKNGQQVIVLQSGTRKAEAIDLPTDLEALISGVETEADVSCEAGEKRVIIRKAVKVTENDDGHLIITESDDGDVPPPPPPPPPAPAAPAAPGAPPPAAPVSTTMKVVVATDPEKKEIVWTTRASDKKGLMMIAESDWTHVQKRTLSGTKPLDDQQLASLQEAVGRCREALPQGIALAAELATAGFSLTLEKPAGASAADWDKALKAFTELSKKARSISPGLRETIVVKKKTNE